MDAAKNRSKLNTEVFKPIAGTSLSISCPGVGPNDPVMWVNGSHAILSSGLGGDPRVSTDAQSNLLIDPIEVTDTGTYACVTGNQVKSIVHLRVGKKTRPEDSKVIVYLFYLLYTFPANFLVFLLCLWVRHRQRQRVLNYHLIDGDGSSDEDTSRDQGSTHTEGTDDQEKSGGEESTDSESSGDEDTSSDEESIVNNNNIEGEDKEQINVGYNDDSEDKLDWGDYRKEIENSDIEESSNDDMGDKEESIKTDMESNETWEEGGETVDGEEKESNRSDTEFD